MEISRELSNSPTFTDEDLPLGIYDNVMVVI